MENLTISRGESKLRSSNRRTPRSDTSPKKRSWAGIPVSYLGRVADLGDRQVVIGEPCSECDYGRVVLSCGVVRCNTCQQSLGEFRQFVDGSFSAARAIKMLQKDLPA